MRGVVCVLAAQAETQESVSCLGVGIPSPQEA